MEYQKGQLVQFDELVGDWILFHMIGDSHMLVKEPDGTCSWVYRQKGPEGEEYVTDLKAPAMHERLKGQDVVFLRKLDQPPFPGGVCRIRPR